MFVVIWHRFCALADMWMVGSDVDGEQGHVCGRAVRIDSALMAAPKCKCAQHICPMMTICSSLTCRWRTEAIRRRLKTCFSEGGRWGVGMVVVAATYSGCGWCSGGVQQSANDLEAEETAHVRCRHLGSRSGTAQHPRRRWTSWGAESGPMR